MKYVTLLVFLLFPSLAFAADKGAPVFYSRTNIVILHSGAATPPSQMPMPWQQPSPESNSVVLDVEVRDGMGLYNQNGWFNLSDYSDHDGVLLTFSKPTTPPITRIAQYAPVDILLVNQQGKITQIIPNLLLSDLEQDIYPDAPITALLFMKGGRCESLSIKPGDEIQHALFKKPPTILNAPK